MGGRAQKNLRLMLAQKLPGKLPPPGGVAIMDTISSDQIVEYNLSQLNNTLSQRLDAEIISIKAPMRPPVDEIIRSRVDALKCEHNTGKDKLCIVLETNGGFIETVERIAVAFRNNYKIVEFFVPNCAYSAGTVLVMSGDEIYMDYFSILGPIDPQYPSEDGEYLPGMGYLAKFNELVKTVNGDIEGNSTRAELAFLLKKFDPAKLFDIEQSIEHSKSLLEEWLPRYKFKDWTVTETNGTPVTDADRKRRAVEIASVLGNAERWHSHGRGITIKELMSEEIKLKVKDFGDDEELNHLIRNYHGLFVDYMKRRGMTGAIHCRLGLRRMS